MGGFGGGEGLGGRTKATISRETGLWKKTLKKLHPMAETDKQTDRRTDRHRDSKTELAQFGD